MRLQACRASRASRGQADSRQARAWDTPSPRGFTLRSSSSRHYRGGGEGGEQMRAERGKRWREKKRGGGKKEIVVEKGCV